ncbi:carboxylesterase/lipase family protein [Microbacterium sp. ASV49]|uniref:Carboxylic ester hydrolase n=1 Tax=Microbacterium candidum TaxID=3041922 RepID=A0ABT7MYT6_9MICO|nr:carboxylesterase/lipase family protein [Microbacterium sp. ASV49]MDL9979617.1 carboxylesterase/lipase family protein [Microbacterium sp. ASV49]
MSHAISSAVPADTCLAPAPAGTFRGTVTGGVRVWRGIRFAQAPAGPLRWRDPVPAIAADREVDATAFGPVCPQRLNPAVPLGEDASMNEDCLSLNVWAPDTPAESPLPVMVWLHGGAYTFGSSSQPLFDATSLVTRGDVVVVTINYRLGAFGFLDLAGLLPDAGFDRNLALKDVLLALAWVRDNVSAFGGDPNRVTVFGESAGGGLVTTLLATPAAEGLFHRAIAQSSPASSVYGIGRAQEVAARFVRQLAIDLSDGAAAADMLRAAPAGDVVEAAMAVYADIPASAPGTLAFAPVVDGDFLPEPPALVLREGRGLPVPIMIGTNRDEASLFRFMKSPLIPITDDRIQQMFGDMAADNPALTPPSLAQVQAAYENARHRSIGLGIARDIGFRMPTVWVAEGHSTIADVWLYRFDHAAPFLRLIGLGATHATELPYLWGNLDGGPKDPTFRLGGRRTAKMISERMQSRWTAFAHGKAPDAPGAPTWDRYDTTRTDLPRQTLVIDREDTMVSDLDAPLRTAYGDEVLAFR